MQNKNSINLLHIDTSAPYCSVAVSNNEILLQHIISNRKLEHASSITIQVQECLEKAGVDRSELRGVVISTGPGSYTGLRIGTAAAKGICYGLNIPLISIDTLTSLAMTSIKKYKLTPQDLIAPVIDARRMEVYTALFCGNGKKIEDAHPLILDKDSFDKYLNFNKILIAGDASDKCEEMLNSSYFQFDSTIFPSAMNLIALGYEKYITADFENIINYEPFYLKGVNITVSNKNIL